MNLSIWDLSAAARMRELASRARDSALIELAVQLDLPMDDAETISFLRGALERAANTIRARELQERADCAKAEIDGGSE